ncbi:MAG: response regulator with CheY-like receiver domain and winged-helix DNA-binding domain [Cyanobacteria bacterium RYN_339]|nr:response regulator with CheY-like receiver domain and winged-helix DNA-binding domain [Cyanobacteria bacterium RYN_339]
MPTAKILVVEDDPDSLRLVSFFLKRAGYEVLEAADGPTALALAEREKPALVILDWQLPMMSGLEVCKRLRAKSDVPIVMLTAKDSVADRVEGLETGADDYVVKPFAPEELVARVAVRLRGASSGGASGSNSLAFSDVTLSADTYQVARGGQPVALSSKEFELLRYFMQHPNKVLRRAQIINEVWGDADAYDPNVLDVYVGYLRSKLEAGGSPRVIHTKRGVGFYLGEG